LYLKDAGEEQLSSSSIVTFHSVNCVVDGMMITPSSAAFFACGHTVLYVGVLYLRQASRPSATQSKPGSLVIRARFMAVIMACILSIIANRYILGQAMLEGQRTGIELWDNALVGWGEWNIDFRKMLEAWLLTALLFLGPIVERLWILRGWRTIKEDVVDSATSLLGWRKL
jgi:prenyl protein peptidase